MVKETNRSMPSMQHPRKLSTLSLGGRTPRNFEEIDEEEMELAVFDKRPSVHLTSVFEDEEIERQRSMLDDKWDERQSCRGDRPGGHEYVNNEW